MSALTDAIRGRWSGSVHDQACRDPRSVYMCANDIASLLAALDREHAKVTHYAPGDGRCTDGGSV